MYDIIIVGGGPAGITAGIYAIRRNLKTLIITKDFGGQVKIASKIENYPGFKEISGIELSERFKEQLERLNAELLIDEVIEIRKEDEKFIVRTLYGKEFISRSIILAIGREQKMLNVRGERRLLGRGVSYCFTCDGPLFKNKKVAVVGGGDSALRAVEFLSEIAEKVYLIHRRGSFGAEERLIESVKSKKNVTFLLNTVVKEIIGEKKVEGIRIENIKSRGEKVLEVDGIFIEIGRTVRKDLIEMLGLETNEKGEIIVDKHCRTNVEGVFAAGDCTDIPEKQIVIAAGMGAIAALSVCKYLKKFKKE